MIHSSSGEYHEANKKGISSFAAGRKSGTDGAISDVHVISIVWLVMMGDFQSRGKEN